MMAYVRKIITGWESYSGLMVRLGKLCSQILTVLTASHFSWINIHASVKSLARSAAIAEPPFKDL